MGRGGKEAADEGGTGRAGGTEKALPAVGGVW